MILKFFLSFLVVGKTCILSQYTEKSFSTDHVPTVGVEFGSKTVSTTNKKALIKV